MIADAPSTSMSTLSELTTLRSLATFLGVDYSTLMWAANTGAANGYRLFEIKKKSGGLRRIRSPKQPLKLVQERIAAALAQLYIPPGTVHGFTKNKSIASNAEAHTNKKWLINIDLEDFFPSINFGRVRGALAAPPYSIHPKISTVIARICCHQNQLPQGAPSSPILSNIVARALDTRFHKLARKFKISYTRYADDISLSGRHNSIPSSLAVEDGANVRCGQELIEAIEGSGFKVNLSKFRLQRKSSRMMVTGLVVNEHVNVRRTLVREIRKLIHAWRKHGYTSANSHYVSKNWRQKTPRQSPPELKHVLRGKLEHLRNIKGETDTVYGLYKQLAALDSSPSLERIKNRMQLLMSNLEFRLRNVVLILEGDSSQGTGFLVNGHGLVTCAHVANEVKYAYYPHAPHIQYPVSIIESDSDRDIALMSVPTLSIPSEHELLQPAVAQEMNIGDSIYLVGFANYAPGSTISIKRAQASQFRVRSGVKRLEVNTGIVTGMSGGPVLDSQERVVGIAITGSDSHKDIDHPEVKHGVVLWSEFLAMRSQSASSPSS